MKGGKEKEEGEDGEQEEKKEADDKRGRTRSQEKGPPPPRAGCVPIVIMILHWGPNNEHSAPVRTLLDTGSSIPLLSITWAQPLDIPMVRRPRVKMVEDFAGEAVKGAGEFYTYCYTPTVYQAKSHGIMNDHSTRAANQR